MRFLWISLVLTNCGFSGNSCSGKSHLPEAEAEERSKARRKAGHKPVPIPVQQPNRRDSPHSKSSVILDEKRISRSPIINSSIMINSVEYVVTASFERGGTFAQVFTVTNGIRSFALKYVDKSEWRKNNRVSMLLNSEPRIHERLVHPNIVPLWDWQEIDDQLYMIEELLGHSLIKEVELRGGYIEEKYAKSIMSQVMQGIAYLHSESIVHRDIKGDNVLLELSDPSLTDNKPNEYKVKIIDLGFARDVSHIPVGVGGIKSQSLYLGTNVYAAPEVWDDQLATFAADIWSAGIMIYAIVCGVFPFKTPDKATALRSIGQGIDLNDPERCKLPEAGLSPLAKDLLSRMLQTDPTKRLTAVEVLNHPWFTEASVPVDLAALPITTETVDLVV